jgi:hypothetical protein
MSLFWTAIRQIFPLCKRQEKVFKVEKQKRKETQQIRENGQQDSRFFSLIYSNLIAENLIFSLCLIHDTA